nr:lariat debranching enzyme [Ziziphus jujuba var. spinosa]
MKIAVEGCMHGDLDAVYKTLQYYERVHNTKIDLLLCCGDFQAVRNEKDLESLSVPPKYRSMQTFWKYYSGEEVAPYPTIFIGGNHEASNYLWELYYGGWAAPNIYFMGFAGVVKFGNLRIGGLSGIYNARHYRLGHFERPPYNDSTIRSVYHVREYDVHKLMQVEEPIDIFLSHDWPLGITDCGDWETLVQDKPFFKKEVQERTLGSKPAAQLLEKLKPPYWFSAHLHCKFSALVQHGEGGPVTKFLALDKCLPRRKFLQIIEIESELGPFEIQYDEEWLAITRRFNSIFPLTAKSANFCNVNLDMQDDRQWIGSKLQARGSKPFEFVQTAQGYNPSKSVSRGPSDEYIRNPQTESLLKFLELPYLLDDMSASSEVLTSPNSLITTGSLSDVNEDIPIDDVDEFEEVAEGDVETEDAKALQTLMGKTSSSFSSSNFLYCFPIFVAVSFYIAASPSCADLSWDFYSTSCPSAELIVRNTVRSASSMDPTIPGKLLRLLFHDCFVEGCDASLLLQGNGTERSDPANASLGGFQVIDSAKRVLEIFCPGTVSCADIVALAARDAVEFTGGPAIQIPTGRRDGKVSSASNVRPNIVDTSFTMEEMIKLFSSKGLSLDDLVTLSGAHTIGSAHCSAFNDRFQQDSHGKLTLIDPSLDSAYANELMKQCPAGASPSKTVDNDPETSFVFDNRYYQNLLARKGLFQSDSVLFTDDRTRGKVESFADDQSSFFDSWNRSFLKLTSIGANTGEEGEIRTSCSSTNA